MNRLLILSLAVSALLLTGCTVKVYDSPPPRAYYHRPYHRVYYLPGHYHFR